jgi:hypothetical protein
MDQPTEAKIKAHVEREARFLQKDIEIPEKERKFVSDTEYGAVN